MSDQTNEEFVAKVPTDRLFLYWPGPVPKDGKIARQNVWFYYKTPDGDDWYLVQTKTGRWKWRSFKGLIPDPGDLRVVGEQGFLNITSRSFLAAREALKLDEPSFCEIFLSTLDRQVDLTRFPVFVPDGEGVGVGPQQHITVGSIPRGQFFIIHDSNVPGPFLNDRHQLRFCYRRRSSGTGWMLSHSQGRWQWSPLSKHWSPESLRHVDRDDVARLTGVNNSDSLLRLGVTDFGETRRPDRCWLGGVDLIKFKVFTPKQPMGNEAGSVADERSCEEVLKELEELLDRGFPGEHPAREEVVVKTPLTQDGVSSKIVSKLNPLFQRSRGMTTIKKVVLGVACVLALGMFVFGGDLFSYLRTSAAKVRSAAKDSVPVEFEIDRARELVTDLMPEIKKNMDTIAREEVAIEKLNKQIESLAGRMSTAKSEMVTLQGDLDKQPTSSRFTYCGKSYTRSQVENDLSARFERYQVDDATYGNLTKMRTMREESLAAAKAKLQEYMAQKRELEVKLEQLSARLKMVELAKTTSEFAFDQDRLGKAKSLVEDLQSRLEVEERLVGAKGDLSNEVVLSDRRTRAANISQRVAQYFDTGTPDASKTTTAVVKGTDANAPSSALLKGYDAEKSQGGLKGDDTKSNSILLKGGDSK